MKKLFQTTAILLIMSLLFSCGLEDFARDYRQLDGDMIRPFSYQFENPELAPGDTAVLKIIFAGLPISPSDITWRVCWNYYTDRYGNMAPRGEGPLNAKIVDSDGDAHSQSITIKFEIPKDMLHKSEVIPENLSEMAALYGIEIPETDFPANKTGILNALDSLAKIPFAHEYIAFEQGVIINGIAQIFSAMFEVYLDFDAPFVGHPQRAKIRHTVRYHGKLSGIPGVFINKNPEIERMRVRTSGGRYEPVEIGDTINISVSKATFLEVLVSDRDSIITLEQAFSQNPNVSFERYARRLFFEGGATHGRISLSDVTKEKPLNSACGLMEFEFTGYENAKVGDTGYVFLVLFDNAIGVVYHPQGRTTTGFPIKFVE